jgi:uncharacterized protein YecA (UPF0149 family)
VRIGQEVQEVLRKDGGLTAETKEERMASDPMSERFAKQEKQRKLEELDKKQRSKEDVEIEEKLLKETPKVEPIKADEAPDRNAPCPCGSGKKYKKCCGAKS